MPNVGPLELIVVLIIALVVLGPKKLPEVGRSIGHGMREFRNSISGRVEEAEPSKLADSKDGVTADSPLEGEIVEPTAAS